MRGIRDVFVVGTCAGWNRDSTLRCPLKKWYPSLQIGWRCMERGDSATNTDLKKRKPFSQGIKKGFINNTLNRFWFSDFNLWCILHVSHDSNPHNCQLKYVKERACFCYPIKSTRCTAHAIFRASGSASKLSKDACLLTGYSCTSGLEHENWILAFPIQTFLAQVCCFLV